MRKLKHKHFKSKIHYTFLRQTMCILLEFFRKLLSYIRYIFISSSLKKVKSPPAPILHKTVPEKPVIIFCSYQNMHKNLYMIHGSISRLCTHNTQYNKI